MNENTAPDLFSQRRAIIIDAVGKDNGRCGAMDPLSQSYDARHSAGVRLRYNVFKE